MRLLFDDRLHFHAVLVLNGGVDVEEDHPATQYADDDEEHQAHHEGRETCEQVLAGREVLIDHEPDAGPERDHRHERAGQARRPGVVGVVHADDDPPARKISGNSP